MHENDRSIFCEYQVGFSARHVQPMPNPRENRPRLTINSTSILAVDLPHDATVTSLHNIHAAEYLLRNVESASQHAQTTRGHIDNGHCGTNQQFTFIDDAAKSVAQLIFDANWQVGGYLCINCNTRKIRGSAFETIAV